MKTVGLDISSIVLLHVPRNADLLRDAIHAATVLFVL